MGLPVIIHQMTQTLICWRTVPSAFLIRTRCRASGNPGTVASRFRRERNPDRIANALLKKDREGCCGGDDTFRAHPSFGQTKMQRIVAAGRKAAIDGDQILDL